jgi:hypothetical protein
VSLEDPKPLVPLTSLSWPYVPDESSYPDPLKRDEPKTLQLHQYEAIGIQSHFSLYTRNPLNCYSATSPDIRKILNEHPNLISMLSSIDTHRGREREEALQRALGVTTHDINNQFKGVEISDDVLALRQFAEAVEAVVRGNNRGALGLDWGPSEA